LHHVESRHAAQPHGQIAVELDHREPASTGEQGRGDGAAAGPDLDQSLARLWIDAAHDGVDDRRVGQEVLTESLAGEMRQRRGRPVVAAR